MKSQKGMTMISLILYVASFFIITTTIAGITTFFYNNVEILDTSIGSNSQYNKFNLYFLNQCKKDGNELFAWFDFETSENNISRLDTANQSTITSGSKKFVTFKDLQGNKNSFIYDKTNEDLYYNYIKICEDVEDFKIKVDESTGKIVLKILIKIDGTAFSTDYVVKS